VEVIPLGARTSEVSATVDTVPLASVVLPAGPSPWRQRLTASGHPRTIFERAIQRPNLLVAETVLRTEIPRPTLRDLLELTALIAMKDPGGSRGSPPAGS
jgi:hypothetical protein